MPRNTRWGWPGNLTLQLGRKRVGEASLPGQAYRPRGHFRGWAWRKRQEGVLGLHGREASSGTGAEPEKASARRGHPDPALGEWMDWGRDRGDAALTYPTV